MKRFIVGALVAVGSSGCSVEKVTHAEALQKERDKNRSEAAKMVELQEKNDDYRRYLDHLFLSDAAVWIFADAFLTFEKAEATCADVGFQLPTEGELSEFFAQVSAKHPEWTDSNATIQVVPGNVHRTPKMEGLAPQVTICRKTKQ